MCRQDVLPPLNHRVKHLVQKALAESRASTKQVPLMGFQAGEEHVGMLQGPKGFVSCCPLLTSEVQVVDSQPRGCWLYFIYTYINIQPSSWN